MLYIFRSTRVLQLTHTHTQRGVLNVEEDQVLNETELSNKFLHLYHNLFITDIGTV